MTTAWQKELYRYFEWLKNHTELGSSWAVGVSGGADSLALILLLADWAKNSNIKLTALTVQHGLRPEAESEAQYVAQLMQKQHIAHQILYWQGEKPTTGIESAARNARYNLMHNWCSEQGIKTLLIAHHKRDQAETFLMRLQRGSGVDGLAAMAPISHWRNLYIIRPLLQITPEQLRSYLKINNINWVEDSSNQCEDFLRVKIRKLLPELEQYIGLTQERICNTAIEMGRVRDYLEKQTHKFIDNNIHFVANTNCCILPNNIFDLHEEIGLRVLSTLIKQIGQLIYPPRMEDIERLWENLHQPTFKGQTLGGCEIFKFQKKIWLIPELKDTRILTKEEWEHFLTQHQEYRTKTELPYKLRRLLYFSSLQKI